MSIFERTEWNEIRDLVNLCWEHYAGVKNKSFVVKPSIPILWFGDLEAYFNSDIKILTVGSNPSDLEFAVENQRKKDSNKNPLPITPSFKRFTGAERICEKLHLSSEEIKTYTLILNKYFKNENRYNWFNCFEPILNGFSASYDELGAYIQKDENYRNSNYNNIAIHTDIYSPLATSPTWSDLEEDSKMILGKGTNLWVSLIDILKPDIILMGYGFHDFKEIVNQLGLKKVLPDEEVFRRYTTCKNGSVKKNTFVDLYKYSRNNINSIVVYGTKSQKPFDRIEKKDRYLLGKNIENMFMKGELR